MSDQSDIVVVHLPSPAVEKAHYQAHLKIKTCGHHGTHDPALDGKDPNETYFDQMLSELAFSRLLFGEQKGIDVFMAERDKRNLDPHHGDGGNDIIEGVDVKSRRKGISFYGKSINQDFLNYDLILREGDRHNKKNDQILVQAIQEYDNSLLNEQYVEQTATVWFTGWEYFYNFYWFMGGLTNINKKITIGGHGWKLRGRQLRPILTLPYLNKSKGDGLMIPAPSSVNYSSRHFFKLPAP